ICGTGTATLQAATAAGTINWYAALTGGASLGTGTSYTTPSIAATTTYYADVTNNGCTSSPRTAVVATVNAIPTITSTTGASICVSGTGTLQAGTAAGTINWYAALTGGASLGTGTSYTTPSIATTTTYYADVTNNGCTSSPRTSIVATVIPSSTASSSQTVCPGLLPSAITLTNYGGTLQWQTSNDNVTFTNIAGQTSATLPANAIGIMAGTKYIRAMVTNGACVTPSNVVTLSPANVNVLTPLTASSYVWNGQSSSDWGTLSNWYSYNGSSLVPAVTLPNQTSHTVIPANTGCILTQPILSYGSVNVNSLVLEPGSQLTQSGGTFWVWSNLIKNGNLTSTNGFIVFFGPNAGTIIGNGTIQFAKMRVNKSAGATLTLQIPVSVSDSLHMWQGNIYTTANNLLTLGLSSASPGTLNYNSGTIVGPFKRFFANSATSGLAGRFPVGTATYNRYAQFDFGTSPGVDQSLTVQYVTGTPNQSGSPLYNGLPLNASGSLIQNYSADGYWSVVPTNNNYTAPITLVNYDVSLLANNLTGMQTPQICRLIKSAGSNTAAQNHVAWSACGTHTAIPGGANPTSFVITSTGSQGFSWFNIGTPNSQALPVEFLEMTTACEEEVVRIQWKTATEHNNDYFRIEKSNTGYDWTLLGYKDAVGNSNAEQTYSYNDDNQRVKNYYRLYQVDMDGSEELLSTLYSDCETMENAFGAYPNPSHGSFSIFWKQFKSTGNAQIIIRDINGKVKYKEQVKLNIGANLYFIKEVFAPGVYTIELIDENYERRLIKHVVN
ncbi:MAG: T9SS C-terminal target domain-containing protein, partial [Flavobacteriia bacterium]|nr:T9SS C-terminal target domain-containing protein [Flavobacteriia bacterium]